MAQPNHHVTTSKNVLKPINNSWDTSTTAPKAKLGLPKKADYQYAVEVASQPASTPAEKAAKAQAIRDKKYLENKYPGIGK